MTDCETKWSGEYAELKKLAYDSNGFEPLLMWSPIYSLLSRDRKRRLQRYCAITRNFDITTDTKKELKNHKFVFDFYMGEDDCDDDIKAFLKEINNVMQCSCDGCVEYRGR